MSRHALNSLILLIVTLPQVIQSQLSSYYADTMATTNIKNFDHFEPPSEEDVEVYQACLVKDGFGGKSSSQSVTIQYYQEITYIGAADGNDIVRNVDLATVQELLALSRITCVRPPAVLAEEEDEDEEGEEEENETNRRRQLQHKQHAVGLSANPEDAILELDCSEPPTNAGDKCMVVDSGFTVFYTGNENDNNNDELKQEYQTAIQKAINSGKIQQANSQIVKIVITDPSTYRPYRGGDGDGNNNPDQDLSPQSNSTLPIVIGALVGSLLIGAAGVAYQRSKRANAAANEAGSGGGGGGSASSSPPRPKKPEEGDI